MSEKNDPIPKHPCKFQFPEPRVGGIFSGAQVEFHYTEMSFNDVENSMYLMKTEYQPFDIVISPPMVEDDGFVLFNCYDKRTKKFGVLRLSYFSEIRSPFEVALVQTKSPGGLTLISYGLINRNIVFNAYFSTSFIYPGEIAYFLYDGYWVDTLDRQMKNGRFDEMSLPNFVHEHALRNFERLTTELRHTGSPAEQIVNPFCLPSRILVKLDTDQYITEMIPFDYSLAFHPDEWQDIPPPTLKGILHIIFTEQNVRCELAKLIQTKPAVVNPTTVEEFPDQLMNSIVRRTLELNSLNSEQNYWVLSTGNTLALRSLEALDNLFQIRFYDSQELVSYQRGELQNMSMSLLEQEEMQMQHRYQKQLENKADIKFNARKKRAEEKRKKYEELLELERLKSIEEYQQKAAELQKKMEEFNLAIEERDREIRREAERRQIEREREERFAIQEIENLRKLRESRILAESSPDRKQKLKTKLDREKRDYDRQIELKEEALLEQMKNEYQIKLKETQNQMFYAVPREVARPEDPNDEPENRAPWEFRKYVNDARKVV